MNRRSFLKRLGIGGGAAVLVAGPVIKSLAHIGEAKPEVLDQLPGADIGVPSKFWTMGANANCSVCGANHRRSQPWTRCCERPHLVVRESNPATCVLLGRAGAPPVNYVSIENWGAYSDEIGWPSEARPS